MDPTLALILCLIFILFLFFLDSKTKIKISYSIYVPVLWFFFPLSLPPSLWMNLGSNVPYSTVEQIAEGSPLDRNVYLILIFIGFFLLLRRKVPWNRVIKNNALIFLFFLFCGLSIFWSDFPLVSVKRYVKSLGNLVMILCLLTYPEPNEAFKTLVRKCTYVLIPLSVTIIKYFPEIGRYFHPWTGYGLNRGLTWNKNSLGYLCLICGFFFIWSLFSILKQNRYAFKNIDIIVHIILLSMTFWLLVKSESATAIGCLIIGTGVLFTLNFKIVRENLNILGVCLLFLVIIITSLNLSSQLLNTFTLQLGRDMTLTGRTEIWATLVDYNFNPLLGVGFESFWLGQRLEEMWALYWWHPNQAHNGYLETYINLGYIGLLLLVGIIISAFRKTSKGLREGNYFSQFCMGFWVMALIYNVTEAAFRGLHPMWLFFLMIALSPPKNQSKNFSSDTIASSQPNNTVLNEK